MADLLLVLCVLGFGFVSVLLAINLLLQAVNIELLPDFNYLLLHLDFEVRNNLKQLMELVVCLLPNALLEQRVVRKVCLDFIVPKLVAVHMQGLLCRYFLVHLLQT